MRSTCRNLIAVVLLTAAAGIAFAQETPPQQPLPPLPVPEKQQQPAPNPDPSAPPADVQSAPQTQPADAPPADAPAVTSSQQSSQETSSRKATVNRNTRKTRVTTKKSTDTAIVKPKDSDAAAAAAAGTASNDANSSTPPSGLATGAVEPAPAAPPPAADPAPAAVDTTTQKTETETKPAGISGWVLGGALVLGLIAVVALTMRRKRNDTVSIYDRGHSTPMVTATKTTTVRTTTGSVPVLPRP